MDPSDSRDRAHLADLIATALALADRMALCDVAIALNCALVAIDGVGRMPPTTINRAEG